MILHYDVVRDASTTPDALTRFLQERNLRWGNPTHRVPIAIALKGLSAMWGIVFYIMETEGWDPATAPKPGEPTHAPTNEIFQLAMEKVASLSLRHEEQLALRVILTASSLAQLPLRPFSGGKIPGGDANLDAWPAMGWAGLPPFGESTNAVEQAEVASWARFFIETLGNPFG